LSFIIGKCVLLDEIVHLVAQTAALARTSILLCFLFFVGVEYIVYALGRLVAITILAALQTLEFGL
jgi:hypothetical protein